MVDAEKLMTLAEYAAHEGRHIQTVRKDAKEGRLPTWKDPVTGKQVTSLATIQRMREAARVAAEAAFLQKNRLSTR